MFPKDEALRRIGQHTLIGAFPQPHKEITVNVSLENLEQKLYNAREQANKAASDDGDRDPDSVH